jgi:hypothetical protein
MNLRDSIEISNITFTICLVDKCVQDYLPLLIYYCDFAWYFQVSVLACIILRVKCHKLSGLAKNVSQWVEYFFAIHLHFIDKLVYLNALLMLKPFLAEVVCVRLGKGFVLKLTRN